MWFQSVGGVFPLPGSERDRSGVWLPENRATPFPYWCLRCSTSDLQTGAAVSIQSRMVCQKPLAYADGMDETPSLQGLGALYESLDAGGRDELLQCLLIAASNGWEQLQELLQMLAFEASVENDLKRL